MSKAKKRKPEPAVAEDVDMDSDFEKSDSEYESDIEEVRPPVRKRRCTGKATKAKAQPRKKQVRGVQGRLAGLVSMPIDIFTEIASHLLPGDIISLARSNKNFRGLLMNRSSSHIWHSAMKNAKGLPPCPPDLSVPHYLALIFSKYCTMCGNPVRCRMDEILRVRLCVPCRQLSVVPLSGLHVEVISLVNASSRIVPSRRRWGWEPHVLQSEANEVTAQLEMLKQSGDDDETEAAISAWKEERIRILAARREQSQELIRFLDSIENDRELELRQMKNRHRLDVERRLLELGWEHGDMQFTFLSPLRREWYSLVEKAKVLTDRTWENLRPKLIPLLESNRDARLKKEQLSRQESRGNRLSKLLNKIKSDTPPMLQLEVLPPNNSPSTSTSSESTSSASHNGVFPDLADALKWPVIKELYDEDTNADEMETRFEARKAEISKLIQEWKVNVEAHMANLLRKAREPDTIEGEVIKPTLVVAEGDADPFASISDDVKLLLRADSLFHIPRPSMTGSSMTVAGTPLIYDAVILSGYIHSYHNLSMTKSVKQPLDLARFHVYTEAQDVARKLLESMGKPDACYLELRSVGQRFICGRCHDTEPKTWEEMVLHYIEQARLWDRIQNDLPLLTKNGITYNDIHDPTTHTDKPLVKYLSYVQLEEEVALSVGQVRACKLCSKTPVMQDVRGPEAKIFTHLLDVHGIFEPKIREHYGDPSIFGVHLDIFHNDLYDSDFDDEGPFWEEYDSDGDYPWWEFLKEVDAWFNKLRPRWMDLVGDYAGDEFFVVDGDSLCQVALEDDLVAIGRDAPSFQILHGLYCLEQAIHELKRRECNFEIAFFECNKHATTLTGDKPFVTSSRSLAREIMKAHICQLAKDAKIGSATFQDLGDPKWKEYLKDKRPMFVLLHTGPALDSVTGNDEFALSRIVLQRTFIRDLLISRLAVSTLNQIKYIDYKVLSFVYERQRVSDTKSGLPDGWSIAEDMCSRKLEAALSDDSSLLPPEDRDAWLMQAAANMINELSPDDPLVAPITFIFIAAQLSIPSISIQQRAQYPCAVDPKLKDYLVSTFYPRIFQHLSSSLADVTFFPDLDGNLFLVLLNCTLNISEATTQELLGPTLAHQVASTWTAANLPLPNLGGLSQFAYVSPEMPSKYESNFELLPFSHEIFDKHFKPIALDIAIQPNSTDERTRIEKLCDERFIDDKHWHNEKHILPKHLGGKDDTTLTTSTSWQKMKRLRREQRFMANLQRHAQTLTGAKGQPIQRIVIAEVATSTVSSGHPPKRGKEAKPAISAHPQASKPGKGSKSKSPQLTSAQKLKARIEAEKQSKKASEDELWWKSQLKEIEALDDIEARFGKLDLIQRGKRTEKGWLSVELTLYRLHLTILAWLGEQPKPEAIGVIYEEYTARVLHSIHQLREHPSLFPAAARVLSQILNVIGFDSFTPPVAKVQEERELGFKFVKLIKSKSGNSINSQLRIKISPIEFQLKAYGALMDRSMDSAPDPRVLDKIDKNESTLVVAPTSAGKTFSSFYAMEKVLRESNDGVIVYVSPTKALCQQIAADVYARFSKNLHGKTVWAIHTRDVRVHDPLKTQILVTVPDILSIMLLSPSLSKAWVPHLKFIILDEIHSIGQLEGGQVWEHIILLSTCPILGLSATVGEPEAFSEWLKSVQEEHGHEYDLIEHKHRYSHLRKHIWQLPKIPEDYQHFPGLKSPAPSDLHLRTLHPMSALLLGGRAVPPDLALESQDCLSLYWMMTDCVPKGEIEHLHPNTFFSGKQRDFLKQADVIRYEEALKSVVNQWMKAPNSDVPGSPYQKLMDALRADMKRDGPVDALEDAHPQNVAIDNFIHLLHKLDSKGDLPCLAFDFDRSGCERYAKALLKALQDGERTWRKSNPRWVEKIKQWEEWKLHAKSRQREAERASRQKQVEPQEAQNSSTWHSTFDPNDPSPEFSFANLKCGYSKEDLKKDIYWTKRQQNPWPDYLMMALERGIAVHHAGMPKGYRVLVESLFRLGYCRVVISTGTLALGINAPAKSVIFLGDSPYLTALMYRQVGLVIVSAYMRLLNFDNSARDVPGDVALTWLVSLKAAWSMSTNFLCQLGKVIFYNLPLDRIHRLMLSRLPPLTGNWPLTTTLCLRLFNLLTGSGHAASAVKAIDSFMRLPRLSVSSDQTRNEVLHHMRFSIEYLRRLRLLSHDGCTTALFAAVGHLYYEEPGNLAFAALVRAGVIHKLCSTFRTNQRETEKNIIHLVATLFARRPLPYFVASTEVLERLCRSLPSMIQLPPLPDYIYKALEQHNVETLQIFSTYAMTFAQQHLVEKPDNKLPLSDHQIGSAEELTEGLIGKALGMTCLKDCVARSTFVSNSGHDDAFKSISELCRSARSGLHLDAHHVPNFSYMDPVNSYALDYWQHESIRPLVEANGLRQGDRAIEPEPETEVVGRKASTRDDQSDEELELGLEQEENENSKPQVKTGVVEDDNDDTGDARAEGELLEDLEIVSRPDGVPEEDWMVYEAFQSVTNTFYEKWRKMWA
ncbi:DEAD/DEAH-box helicase [Ceratobasidium theobromae]|uniref:DEAD/DEAH-box helicase n=1 Tax=Ceratobasidium theobromae TaxID=1582974 RepID=A0A5N5QAG2_9AGAM|nr:DEAD/DEAH-box helicase [Ceratobasidium theobromae]